MSRIVVSQYMTLDGVIEAPGPDPSFDRGGWAFQFSTGDEGQQLKLDEVMGASALLLGRTTYDGFAAAWPTMTGTGVFGEKMNGMPKYVVSSTLDSPEWNNTTVINGDITGQVAKLRSEPGGDILVNGSAKLIGLLAEHNLIDEYRLTVCPVVVGAGKRLFGTTSGASTLNLISARPLGPDGVVLLTYQPAN